MGKIVDIIKLFLEKYFVITLVSIPISIVIFAKIPDIWQVSENTSDRLYLILIFCLTFLSILLIKKTTECICSKREKNRKKKEESSYLEIEYRNSMEQLWTYVDGLSQSDRKILMEFIHTNNRPIEKKSFHIGNSIFNNREIMYETIAKDKETKLVGNTKRNSLKTNMTYVPIDQVVAYQQVIKYKLKDNFFRLLKHSYEEYGRISHFEEE